MALRWYIGDFETRSLCNLKEAGAWRYAEDLSTEIICFNLTDPHGNKRRWYPGDDPAWLIELAADEEVTIISWNVGFEKAIWRTILVRDLGFPDIPNPRWHDIMAAAAMKTIPQKLERAGPVLRLPVQKDMEGNKLVLSLSKPNRKGMLPDITPEIRKRASDYCDTDLDTELEAHARLGFLPPGERKVWLLDQRINERGVRLDMEYVAKAQEVVDKASVPLLAEFARLTGGLKPTQRDKVIEWCSDNGFRPDNMQKEYMDEILGSLEGEEDDGDDSAAGEADLGGIPPIVREALQIRQLVTSASIKKLRRMRTCVCSTGRAYGLLQYHGAGPGRWAGRLLQPQNFPRGSLKLDGEAPPPELLVSAIMTGDPEYVQMMYGPPVQAVVSGLRHAIIADPGRALLSGDFSTIEARICLALAGQHDKTAIMAAGKDIYIDMAQQIYKCPVDKKKDPEKRQTGKNAVLGLGFGMGAPKFQSKYAKKEPLEFAQNVVETYRKEWAPLVPKLWYGLMGAATQTVHDRTVNEAFGVEYRLEDGWLTARLPSGRKLWYRNPQPAREAMPWDETDIRRMFTYEALKMGQWKTIKAFGGLLTENVVQALARDLMVAAMFRAEQAGLPVILTVHDEIVCEPEAARADVKALDQLMREGTVWSKALQIPIATETWTGDRYKK